MLCSTGYSAQTYVDARGGATGNTVNASTGSTTDWWVTGTLQDNKWGRRVGFANNTSFTLGGDSDILESSGTGSGRENSPMIKTVISGLYPGVYYNVWVAYWSAGGQNWQVRAGLTPTALPLYDALGTSPAIAGTATGKMEGDRSEYTAPLGYTAADSGGQVNVYIDDRPSDASQGGWYDRSWYDGVLYEVFNVPYSPSPATAAVNVPLSTSVLSWTPVRDPNNLTQEDPNFVSQKIYFDDDPNLADVSDLIATLPKGTNQTAMPTLENNKTYYWRVDTVRSSGAVLTGIAWTFETVKTTPDFNPPIGSQPQSTSADLGDDAVLTASAGAGDFDYQWYRGASGVMSSPVVNQAGHISGADTSQLTITTAAADEGSYWCWAGNILGSANSNAATVTVKRIVAHWTLDALVSGQYADSTPEGHHADPNGIPVFVDGANPAVTNSGVQIDTENGMAQAGTWNPSEISGQFTVSFWANWAGQTDPTTWQGLISKETTYGADTMMWQLEITQATEASSTVVLKNGMETGNLSIPALAVDTWEYIAVTFNGATAAIYHNGVQAASGVWSMGAKTDAPINIGISAWGTAQQLNFNGALDDIQIYNYALTPTQIAVLYTDVQTDVSVCIENPDMDLSGPAGTPDCKVNMHDFAKIAENWLICNLVPSSSCD
jgi:hypothetical protein